LPWYGIAPHRRFAREHAGAPAPEREPGARIARRRRCALSVAGNLFLASPASTAAWAAARVSKEPISLKFFSADSLTPDQAAHAPRSRGVPIGQKIALSQTLLAICSRCRLARPDAFLRTTALCGGLTDHRSPSIPRPDLKDETHHGAHRGGRAALHRYAAARHHGPEPRRPDHQVEPGGNEKDLISVGHDCMPANPVTER
jgi:hypothetical protein